MLQLRRPGPTAYIMINRTRLLLVSTALAAVAFYALTPSRKDEPAPARAESDPFAFVKSMRGTAPDGQARTDDANAVVADAELRHMFDYYLGAIGEKTLPQIRAEIELQLEHQLPPAALPSAKQLLARYIDYKTALIDLEKNPPQAPGVSPMRARLIAMQQMRTRFFSPKEISGMFGFDDAFDQDAVARWEIAQDPKLSAEEKRTRLAKLDADLPPALRKEREAPLVVAKEEETAAKMRAAGAGEDAIYRMRAATFSPEAAARMAAVDQETANWKSRINDYLDQRNKVLGNGALNEADRQAALQQLRDARFSSIEQKRLGAYE